MTFKYSKNGEVGNITPGTIYGVPNGYDAHVLIDLFTQTKTHLIYVCYNDRRMADTREAIRFLAPKLPILEFPAWDCPPYSRISPNSKISARRTRTLAQASHLRNDINLIVLTTSNAVIQRQAPKHVFAKSVFKAKLDKQINFDKFMEYLETIGFQRVSRVVDVGEYAIRGGIVDVYPPGYSNPVRLDFFGDKLDGIRQFNTESQRTLRHLNAVTFVPNSEVILDPDSISRFRHMYRSEFGVIDRGNVIYSNVTDGLKFQGIEHWLPFFYAQTEQFIDYFPDASIVIDSGVSEAIEHRWKHLNELYLDRKNLGSGKRSNSERGHACRPELLYLDPESFNSSLMKRIVYRFNNNPPSIEKSVNAHGKQGHNFSLERQQGTTHLMSSLSELISTSRKSSNVLISCWSEGARERISQIFEDEDIRGGQLVSNGYDFLQNSNQLGLAVWKLPYGYNSPNLRVISEQDIFGDRLVRSTQKKSQNHVGLGEESGLQPGELVVHAEHGIGRYISLETLSINNSKQDFVVIEYADKARLSIPVETIYLLSRYGHGDAQLDKLGAASWQERKSRMKKRLLEIAEDLIRVAAEREMQQAPVMVREMYAWDSFLTRFEYQDTDDQTNATDEVLNDLEKAKPMDRLICGDVGFGKTEVAMRAAFVATMAGYQVAVLAPTTLLVRQHYANFSRRFSAFPIEIEQLSRMKSRVESESIKSRIKDGKVDIAIGTHSLLSKTVQFNNLGLLIIDEEQNFGVVQKEHLKQLRSNIHILTLTATPIPRTMQMALSGVRDMSIIATPPADRLVIRTYVSEFDEVTVRQALLREHYRGGQSFMVVPKIKDISQASKFLDTHIPEVSYTIAHGQLNSDDLEEQTRIFYDGERDVLLSTNIIASGLDIPTANTVIVLNAHRFGLAQLYQIRGRVGRSYLRAYAYISYPRLSTLSDSATARLRVLSAIDDLGAGLVVSAQDLENRGAGNLLGGAQSGHIQEVGFELYQQMLEEAVVDMKVSHGMLASLPIQDDWTPQLNLGVAALIPESYIPDIEIRLGLYRRLASLKMSKEIDSILAEMIDRFGSIPTELQLFVKLITIRNLCKQAGIERIDCNSKEVTVRFRNKNFVSPVKLLEYVNKQPGRIRILNNGLVIIRHWSTDTGRVAGIHAITKELADICQTDAVNSMEDTNVAA